MYACVVMCHEKVLVCVGREKCCDIVSERCVQNDFFVRTCRILSTYAQPNVCTSAKREAASRCRWPKEAVRHYYTPTGNKTA